MEQCRIKALLQEAAQPNCSRQRRTEISNRLGHATAAMGEDGVYKIEGHEAGLNALQNILYHEIIDNRPELLPVFYPVFALICGDPRSEHSFYGNVDWSLVD